MLGSRRGRCGLGPIRSPGPAYDLQFVPDQRPGRARRRGHAGRPTTRGVRPARPHTGLTADGQADPRGADLLPPRQPARRPRQDAGLGAAPRRVVDPRRGRRRPGVRPAVWFGREAPLVVEIGSRRGGGDRALAAARPSYDVLALRGLAARGRRHVLAAGAGRRRQRPAGQRRRGVVDAAPARRPARCTSCGRSSPTRGPSSGTTGAGWSSPEFAHAGGDPARAGRRCGGWRPTGATTPSRWPRCSTPSRCSRTCTTAPRRGGRTGR